MGGAVLDGELDGGALALGRFGLEDGELPLLGDREDLGGLALAGGVALAQVTVDDDPHRTDPAADPAADAVVRRR